MELTFKGLPAFSAVVAPAAGTSAAISAQESFSMKFLSTIALLSASMQVGLVTEVGSSTRESHDPGLTASQQAAEAPAVMTQAEIKKLDKDLAKVTLKHGPLPHLGMPAMTMVFKVQNPAQLAPLHIGNVVNFIVERVDGALLVTTIQPVQ